MSILVTIWIINSCPNWEHDIAFDTSRQELEANEFLMTMVTKIL